ncbi:MAG: DUF465 domain-containing protein [Robiginitomaculum sp.]|nr:MAG: DUF465 domain-containing protein [Robiginitomaculum sp.]
MTMQARIRKLDDRHTHLDTQITEELKHPAHDQMLISALKKQKMALKEQLNDLRRQE